MGFVSKTLLAAVPLFQLNSKSHTVRLQPPNLVNLYRLAIIVQGTLLVQPTVPEFRNCSLWASKCTPFIQKKTNQHLNVFDSMH